MSWVALLAAALGAAVALAVGANAMRLGEGLGLLDWPDLGGGRKRHARVTPLMGGTAVMIPALVGLALAGMADASPVVAAHLGWFAIAAGALYLIGMADDRFGLGPRLRLVCAVGVFTLALVYAPDFRLAFLRFGGLDQLILLGALALPFTLACVVGFLNAVNMADGKNGLVIALSLFWVLMLWPPAPSHLDPALAALAAALAVAFVFNMRDRFFLGDGGSYGLSALIGLIAIYVFNHAFAEWRAERIALLFAVPVFDTLRLVAWRLMQGRSPFQADRDHLHHHIAYRWGWPRGLAIYLALVATPNLLALAFPGAAVALLLATVVAYAAVLVLSTRETAFSPDVRARGPDTLRAERAGASAGAAPPAGA
jgi:UDP-GlcNAc:undecaprenyl-phosphate GlcNAc-1-phosphate transferase